MHRLYKGRSDRDRDALDTEGWQPVYEELPCWKTDITGVRSEAEFPKAFADYIRYIEQATGTPIKIVSVGPDREATIIR